MKSPLFRFIAASGLTNLADGIAVVAWAWLVTLLTRDALLVALVPVALRLPWFIFALPAGVITDRVDRRRLILWMDALRGLAFMAVAVVLIAATPLPAPPATGLAAPGLYLMLLGAATAVGVAEVFRDNAAQTMLPAIVPPEGLERANGRLWSVELVGNALLGPALGAFLIAYAVFSPFAVNALAYVAAVLILLRLKGTFRPVQTQTKDWRAELKEGIAFLRAAPLLRALAVITGVWNLFFEMVMIALVLHVQENLGLGAEQYGLILAAGAVGGILGGLYGDQIVARLGPLRTAQWMLLASAPAFAAMAVAPGAISLGVVLMLFNFTGLVWNTVSVSYRQRMIPDALLGRVNSIYRLLAWGMMPVGLLLSGLIVRGVEGALGREAALVSPFWVGTLGALALAVFGWRALARHWPAG